MVLAAFAAGPAELLLPDPARAELVLAVAAHALIGADGGDGGCSGSGRLPAGGRWPPSSSAVKRLTAGEAAGRGSEYGGAAE